MSSLKVDTSKALSFYREYKHEFILVQEKKEICYNHCDDLKKKLKLACSEFEEESIRENIGFWETKIKNLNGSLDELSYYITDLEKEFWILVNNEVKNWIISHNFDVIGTERDNFMRKEYLRHLNFLTLLAEEIDNAITKSNVDINDPVVEMDEDYLNEEAEDVLKKSENLFLSRFDGFNSLYKDERFNSDVSSKIDFSYFATDEDKIKHFFKENKDYIINFSNYFDEDLDYVVLHLECVGLRIFDNLSIDEKRSLLIEKINLYS